ncbi:MAG: CBS domain-containing protein [Pseudomonadota bacterium]
MLVSQILDLKAGSDVVTISCRASVADAAQLLSEKRIGAVVVLDDDKPVGILSERDVVRDLGRRGEGCLKDKVDALMTRKMITASPQESADQVLTKMTAGRFRHMPVMEGETMIGLISIGDVVKARLSELAMEKDALEGMIMGH